MRLAPATRGLVFIVAIFCSKSNILQTEPQISPLRCTPVEMTK